MPNFIIQGGDPTNTGVGGESIYDGGALDEPREDHGIWPQEERKGKNAGKHGVGFKDEFHSRLKFNRRGLLGMANEGPDSNGSQFFLTLGDTPELQGKNTLFGRVAGETIYNVSKMGEAEVDGERPIYPTKVTSCEVLINPFKDMVAKIRTAAPTVKEKPQVKKRKKAGKQLLSFGDEEGDAEETTPVLKKTKYDTRIVTAGEEEDREHTPEPSKRMAAKKVEKPMRKSKASPEPQEESPQKPPSRPIKPQQLSSPVPEVEKVTTLLERTNAQIAELKASMKRNISTAPVKEKKKSALDNLIPENSIRGRKRNPGASSAAKGDQQALDILNTFRSKLDAAPAEKQSATASLPLETSTSNELAAVKDDGDDEAALCDLHFIANCQSCKSWDTNTEQDGDDGVDGDMGWLSHALNFTKDKLGKDLTYRKKAEDELVVIDPREKEKSLKEEMKSKREARAGKKTGRQWDEERSTRKTH